MESECRRKWKARFALRRDILKEFLAEFLGIFVLIFFGCGSVAQAVLSKGTLGEPLTIHLGFTLGLMMAAYIAGGVSGAHVNPAVTLAMVMLGKTSWKKFPVYVAAQFLGAFAGACCVYMVNYDALMEFSNGEFIVTGENATAGIFASYPAKHLSTLNGFLDQVAGSAALILCILAITDSQNIGAPKGMEPLCIGVIILAIGVSMGLNCGYPINPARDLSPRLFTAVAGWGGDVFRAGGCWWWIPVFGPMVGGAVGAAIYFLFIELHHAEPKQQEENNGQQKYEIVTLT
ncbi:aquaporin-9b [Corythoichthys intestinalis]|uniref:aquaporin-9b n=1 Tax=Corythoichthys intestinalis TaxID=161448 RepID=UPI0025A4E812|nr:aquaporin-9b [Corythoichthys intestinalis]XP_057687425.1 aquaporin-9b [Corythoichthys intestinalis]XP_061795935.1 aquaporin-9-like [Nerophis lumbriciformis]